MTTRYQTNRSDYVKNLSVTRQTWDQLCLLATLQERTLRSVMARLVRAECERTGLLPSVPPHTAHTEETPDAPV